MGRSERWRTAVAGRPGVISLLLLLPAFQSSVSALPVTGQPESAAQRTVLLARDACVSVSPGDEVVFTWNPRFDLSGVTTGLQQFRLTFVSSAARAGHAPATLQLITSPPSFSDNGDNLTTHLEDGSYELRFHPQLAGLPPGRYVLSDAAATAQTAPDYHGVPPRMLNSPAGFAALCIDVPAQQPAPGRNGQESTSRPAQRELRQTPGLGR